MFILMVHCQWVHLRLFKLFPITGVVLAIQSFTQLNLPVTANIGYNAKECFIAVRSHLKP